MEKRKEGWNFSDTDHHQVWYNERTIYYFDELLSFQSLDKTVMIANAEMMVSFYFLFTFAISFFWFYFLNKQKKPLSFAFVS